MEHIFEIYITTDEITQERWRQLHSIICEQLGVLPKYQIIIGFEENVIRYFVASNRDLGQLSNNIDFGVLRPFNPDELKIPEKASREGFIKFITGGNILDLKEKTGIKRGKHLQFAVFNIRAVNSSSAITSLNLYFKGASGKYTVATKKIFNFPSHLLAIDFKVNTGYLRKTPPKYLNIEKTVQMFEPMDTNALFSINGFPFSQKDYYLPLNNYEFDKHSFIIGASGSGKSRFIQLYVDRLAQTAQKSNYRVIVIDPHDSLREDLVKVEDSYIVNFANEAAELFGGETQTDVSAATELTVSLMKSLLADQFNARLERVLRFSLYVLFVSQAMSLGMLKRFLTELDLRNQIISHTGEHIPPNIRQFFGTDFNEMRTTHYNEAILPIVSLVDEMQLQPSLVNESEQSLARLIQANFLTVFSLNKVSMGEKVVKTVAGLLVQQIFLLAQAKAFNERVILIIDEVSVVQNPALASILSEARKFNLTVMLTQQYFGQVEEDLRNAIFANVYNYYAFRVSEEDARALAGNLQMEIPKEILTAEKAKGVKEEELKIKYMTELHPRECLCRLSSEGKVLPCFKGRTMDIGTMSAHQPKIDEGDLKEYKAPKVKDARPKKFVEADAIAADAGVQDFPGTGSDASILSQTGTPKIETPNLGLQPPGPQVPMPSVGGGGPSDFEKEPAFNFEESPDLAPENNPEIDPAIRQAAKNDSGQTVVAPPAAAMPIISAPGATEPMPGPGNGNTYSSMSLSELLASQSANANKKD